MKKIRSRFRYISGRVFCLWTLGILALCCLAAVQAVLKAPYWTSFLLLAAAAVFFLAGWLWVLRPYRNSEKWMRRFLDGYLFYGKESEEMTMLTPSMRSQMELIEKMVRSPQMMDLNKRQAQYLALQNQINPHFLYNTLESIRGEALIAGLESVADMTESLARFFRYTITKVENLVSVEEELDNCETYFSIQKYRFGSRLQLHIEYEPEEREEIMNCRIPKLTLQPILENSIIHGTELKIGTGNLYIHFELTEQRLLIRISDDGVGMDETTLARLNRRLGREADSLIPGGEEGKGGIALANVNNRIHLIFGDEYGLHVHSVPQCGTDVEISLPVVMDDRKLKNVLS